MPEPANRNTDPVLAELEGRVAELTRRAADHLGVRLPAFEVRADLHGLAAGRAVVRGTRRTLDVTIRFNARVHDDPRLLENALAEIAPHEVAHGAIGVWARHRRRRVRPHGPEWLDLCRALGGSGRTTHTLPLERARRHREYEYRLEDGRCIWLGPVQHRRLQEERARYFHRRLAVIPGAHTGRWRYRK